MLTQEKIDAMKRIKEEFKDLNNNPISNIGVTVGLPNEDNIFEWQCSLMGPRDTSYSGGIFILSVKFPDNYPKKAPEVIFKTPIYHININHKKLEGQGAEPLGHVCISTLNWWTPKCTIRQVLTDIFALFWLSNPESPYGLERAKEMNTNINLYNAKCKYYTQKYADMNKDEVVYTTDWNFSDPVNV